MKLGNIKVDSARAEQGEWIKNIPEMEDLELLVRAPHCASARALRTKLLRALPAHIRTDPDGIPMERVDEIEAQVMVEAVLVDWRNLDGMPYSKENALKLLMDPDFILFRDAVSWASNRVGRSNAEARETEAGN